MRHVQRVNKPLCGATFARVSRLLQVATRFNDWIMRRIADYGSEEDRDFTVLKNEYRQNQGLSDSSVYALDYYISLKASITASATPVTSLQGQNV